MPENSRKNKRGARGSVEDDVNKAKRQVKTSENMADNDNQEKSEVEPTLLDLRGMLVVLQCSVCKQHSKRQSKTARRNVGAKIISGYSRPRISKDERISRTHNKGE